MMADRAGLAKLIIRYMAIEPGDEVSRRRWADEVRAQYPYERPMLTATIGEILESREGSLGWPYGGGC
jgi:hypothetical protein